MRSLLISQKHLFVFDTIFLLQSYMPVVLILRPYLIWRSIIHAFLNDRIQVAKVGTFYIDTFQIIYGVPQGSIFGPLSFKVSLINLFLEEHYKLDFSNYADDTTPYNCRCSFLKTISELEITLDNLFKWSFYNNFKANVSKCHLFLIVF